MGNRIRVEEVMCAAQGQSNSKGPEVMLVNTKMWLGRVQYNSVHSPKLHREV